MLLMLFVSIIITYGPIFSEFENKSSPSPKIIHFLSVSDSATNSIKMYGEKKLSAYK